jgi:hypothetical protein
MRSRRQRAWILVVQLWSMKQDEDALSPLLFLGPPLLPEKTSLLAARWGYGRRQALSCTATAEMLATLSRVKMNRLEVKCQIGKYQPPRSTITIRKVATTVFISPTCSLWADARGYTAASSSAEKMRWSFEHEQFAARNIDYWPTVHSTQIELTSPDEFAQIQGVVLPLLAASLASCSLTNLGGGCADLWPDTDNFDDPDCYPVLGLLADLSHDIRLFRTLRTRWDALHPFLIGPYKRCAKLCQLTAIPAKLRKVRGGSEERTLGVVAIVGRDWHYQTYQRGRERIERPVWGSPEWYEQAAPFLVPVEQIGT